MARCDEVAGFILAGGASSRMGRDKALLEIEGVPLLVRLARLVEPLVRRCAVVGPVERYAALDLPVIPDQQPGLGPLGGIATALNVSPCEWNLLLSCDLPYLSAPWLEYLIRRAVASGADAVLPVSARGPQPLCAMYRKTCEASLANALARNNLKVISALVDLNVDRIEEADWKPFDSAGRLFKNMNAPGDYEEARAILKKEMGA